MPNALAACASPYLRQHADNPVAWVPWSEAAFADARLRDVPVLVSIGYSTCHWCHVMAHESFEDPETAEQMNRQFVCIKVDREEHPEVDAIYMDAVQALTGHGGWPLNAVVDHQGRPFYACTYLPRANWRQLLDHLHTLWTTDQPRIASAAAEITAHLMQEEAPRPGGTMPLDLDDRLAQQLSRAYDPANPGYGWTPAKAPKFPPSQILNHLVAHERADFQAQADAILEAMQDAGLHDRVGGGFHRYSVDARWRLPHFEKMLYDNAQLIRAYALAAARTGRADFLRTATNAGDYLLRDLRVEDGPRFTGYAAAEDANDPRGEGSFYAWSPAQVSEALGETAGRRLAAEWDLRHGEPEVGPHGHVDPVVSHIPHPRGTGLGDDPPARRASWEAHLPILRRLRDQRPRPGRDDKVLTDQNGLVLEALAWLARITGESRFIHATSELAAVLRQRLTPAGLLRLPGRPAVLADYGALVTGLTAAFDALGDPALITTAIAVADEAVARLRADDGGFYTAPTGRSDLIRRGREDLDNAQPGGQSSLALGFVRLHHLTGQGRWRALAEGIFSAASAIAGQAPSACATLLEAVRQARLGERTAVVTGDPADPQRGPLLIALRRRGDPHLAIVPAAECREQPWACLDGRRDIAEPQVLVCVGDRCLAPIKTVGAIAQLGAVR